MARDKDKAAKKDRVKTRRVKGDLDVVPRDETAPHKPDPAKKGLKGLETVEARNPGTGKVPSPHQTVAVPTPRNDLPALSEMRRHAVAYKKKLAKVKPVRVVALERGYYGDRIWEPGEKFDMRIDPDLEAPRWVALVKGKSAQTPDEEFGPDEDDTHDEDKDTDEDDEEI